MKNGIVIDHNNESNRRECRMWCENISWDAVRYYPPDFEIDSIRLHRIDCMKYMAEKPDKYYDLAIVDPPYGIKKDGQKRSICKNPKNNRKEHAQKNWDSNIPRAEYFIELRRISEHQIIWGANYYPQHLTGTMGWIFWDKGQELNQSDGELAYTSFERAFRRITINRVELLKDGTIHPTQKPIKLYRWLLQNYAEAGQRIIDTHGGSFSSAIACYLEGFEYDGCEIDDDYYQAGCKRFEQTTKQQRFF